MFGQIYEQLIWDDLLAKALDKIFESALKNLSFVHKLKDGLTFHNNL